MAKRKKTIIAGNHVEVCVYSMQYPHDAPRTRAAKQKASSAARKAMNAKSSRKKCRLKVLANFDDQDLFVTLTYDDKHLPADRAGAKGMLKYFLRKLRTIRKKYGQETKYVYVTENEHEGRLHHHLILNSTGSDDLDITLMRQLWAFGAVDMEFLRTHGIAHYCDYITKERDPERPNGAQMWTGSRNLVQPTEINEIIPDNETITCPPNAVVLEREEKQNEFGAFCYLSYMILPEDNRPTRPSWRKKKT